MKEKKKKKKNQMWQVCPESECDNKPVMDVKIGDESHNYCCQKGMEKSINDFKESMSDDKKFYMETKVVAKGLPLVTEIVADLENQGYKMISEGITDNNDGYYICLMALDKLTA